MRSIYWFSCNVTADASSQLNRYYHLSGLALAGITPVALVLSPSILNIPLDYALAVGLPFHAHVGLNYVISDYVPKQMRGFARMGLFGVTLCTVFGILTLNWEGPGLTQTIKGLWQPKKDDDASKADH